jgi:hypothetical protein
MVDKCRGKAASEMGLKGPKIATRQPMLLSGETTSTFAGRNEQGAGRASKVRLQLKS